MARKPRTEQAHELAVSDAAAAYIAEALMQLALEFENNHYAQIRRHYQSIAHEPDHDPRQLDLFREQLPPRSWRRAEIMLSSPSSFVRPRRRPSSAPTADRRGRCAQTPSRSAGTP